MVLVPISHSSIQRTAKMHARYFFRESDRPWNSRQDRKALRHRQRIRRRLQNGRPTVNKVPNLA